MLMRLLQTPENLGPTREWYRASLNRMNPTTPQGRMRRMAYLATEGAFLLRFLSLIEMDETEIKEVFDDIVQLAKDIST